MEGFIYLGLGDKNMSLEGKQMDSFMQNPPYQSHLGRLVEVGMQGRTEIGVYRGKTEGGDLVLQPFVQTLHPAKDNDKPTYVWNKSSAKISHNMVNVFCEANEGEVRSLTTRHLPDIWTPLDDF